MIFANHRHGEGIVQTPNDCGFGRVSAVKTEEVRKSVARKGVPVRVRPSVVSVVEEEKREHFRCSRFVCLVLLQLLFMLRLVLASASLRRSQLLRDLGLSFEIAPTHAEEPAPTLADCQNPGAYVERLARLKAAACEQDGLIIAADTTVVLDEHILNKPANEAEALAMLQRLRGRTHRVFTGMCLRRGAQLWSEHECTSVTFGTLSEEFLRAYVATGEPLDKAGAYGAQGRGALLIERIEGDYWNVVGLPVFRLARMLSEHGVQVQQFWNEENETKS